MRPQCTWSMSTVGLTAQEISFPIESPFLRGSNCHSMAHSKPTWNYPHELDNFYFTMESAHTDYSSRPQLKIPPPPSYERHINGPGSQRSLPKKCRPSHVSLSSAVEPSTPSPAEDAQVVPSFERLSMCSSPPGRGSKPLPPTPPRTDASPAYVQPADGEPEFIACSDDSCCLVADHCPKSSPFRYGLSARRSLRDCGQINYAYYDGPLGQQTPRRTEQQGQGPPVQDVQQQQQETASCQRQQDKAQRRLRRWHSGPAGSFNKPLLLRLGCQKRATDGTDWPEAPPPVPPRTGDLRRLSAAYAEEDKPPVVPPREPLSRGSFRNPSPKSLPTYQNGVMPPTQSFAPDPKYVSFQRQNSDCSPRIRPVIKNNEKVSDTHYYLSYC